MKHQKQNILLMLKHIQNHFISALIIQGMANDPTVDVKKIETIYNSLDESLKNTKPGKAIKTKIRLK